MSTESLSRSWRSFLIDTAFARDYPTFFAIAGLSAVVPRNPILEGLLPGLLQIKAVAILDETLRTRLAKTGQSPREHGFRDDLHGRIETALAVGILSDVGLLHRARGSRNDVAHGFDEKLDWARLEADVEAINEALQTMGVVGPRPVLVVRGERARKPASNPDVLFSLGYTVAVYEADAVMAEIKWSTDIGRSPDRPTS